MYIMLAALFVVVGRPFPIVLSYPVLSCPVLSSPLLSFYHKSPSNQKSHFPLNPVKLLTSPSKPFNSSSFSCLISILSNFSHVQYST